MMVESKLGKPGAQIRPWEHRQPPAAYYREPLQNLLKDMTRWQETMRHFYQLLRYLILANELCLPGCWQLEPHLLAIVNDLNRQGPRRSHTQAFADFQSNLKLSDSHSFIDLAGSARTCRSHARTLRTDCSGLRQNPDISFAVAAITWVYLLDKGRRVHASAQPCSELSN